MDIRNLNELLIFNTYVLPGQSKIIAILQKCTYIAVFDAAFFF